MKKTILYLALAALFCGNCARQPSTGLNDANKRYLDAWIQVNHPGAPQTELGSYILEDIPGTGFLAGDGDVNSYVRLEYTIRDLNGSVLAACTEQMARQLGDYDPTEYYGPLIWVRGTNVLAAGLEEALSDMREGGSRTVLIPGWLLSSKLFYKTAKEYQDNVSGTSAIYELKLMNVIDNIQKWETDSVGRYMYHHFPGMSVADSLKYGFYYARTGEPSRNVSFPADTTLYLNYVLRLLNGKVVDTNVRDTAAYYNIYSASRTYSPAEIKWYGEDGTYQNIKFNGSSDMIDGFLYALDQMHPDEKGAAVFYSGLGYKSSGKSPSIPAYSPLRFDIELVAKP